jgi:hypothetical protein
MSGMPDATDNGYVLPRRMEGPQFAPFPGYVQTPEQRRRWEVCADAAATLSALHEPSGGPDSRFVWVTTRALYNSDIPTGELPAAEARRRPGRVAEAAPSSRQRAARPDGVNSSAHERTEPDSRSGTSSATASLCVWPA